MAQSGEFIATLVKVMLNYSRQAFFFLLFMMLAYMIGGLVGSKSAYKNIVDDCIYMEKFRMENRVWHCKMK